MISRRVLLTGTAAAAACAIPAVAISPRSGGLDRETRQSRIAWLERHATPLRSLDIAEDDFLDLEPFARAISDARIVMLGEQSHGDGTTFLAKNRFVRFLHERMGFDVLAFESGLYDMDKVWQRICAGQSTKTAARNGLYKIWSVSEQVQPLLGYVEAHARSSRPLELAGFDCKMTGAKGEWLADDLQAFLAANGIDTGELAEWPRLREQLVGMADVSTWKPSAAERDFVVAALRNLTAAITDLKGAKAAFWRQTCKSLAAYADVWHRGMVEGNAPAAIARRDESMGDNLIWLAREAFAGRKIIVWAATAHNVRNLHLLGGDDPYSQIKMMGHYVWEALGEETYNVAFLGYEGRTAWANGGYPEMNLDRPPADSLEDLWGATTHDNAFLDLRRVAPGGEWLRERLTARPVGSGPITAKMSELFDAAVFLRRMEPSTRAAGTV